MNQNLREVVAQFIAPPKTLTHTRVVQRLYKQSLKTLESWIIDRRLWNEEAVKIRAQFEATRHLAPDSEYVLTSLYRYKSSQCDSPTVKKSSPFANKRSK